MTAESVALVAGACDACPDVIEPGETVLFFGGNDVRHSVCPSDTRPIPPAEKDDCVSVGFSGEGRCIEVATTDGLCDQHAEQPSARRFDEHG